MEAPLLGKYSPAPYDVARRPITFTTRVCRELKELWRTVGPAIFARVVMYGIDVVTLSTAGHLGDLELAAVSVAVTVIQGLNFGLFLGMATALETVCGQAYGARRYSSLGVYLQRSWIVLLAFAVVLSPMYVFSDRLLVLLGQPAALAEEVRRVSVWLIPEHFAVAVALPVTKFLQSQVNNSVTAAAAGAALVAHALLSWVAVHQLGLGGAGAAAVLSFSWWLFFILQLAYVVGGGCPETWKGPSAEAFAGLADFLKLAAASGVMICLENWYYRILILITGHLQNAQTALDALAVCMSISGWQLMIPLAFLAGTGVRVSNELGAGNGGGAKFAVKVSLANSLVVGLLFFAGIILFHYNLVLIFTTSSTVAAAVDDLATLLAFTVLLNSIQPVLSGVAVGAGWQSTVAYVNVGSYYLIGIPFGVLLGWVFHLGVKGVWAGMICGTAVQIVILGRLTSRYNWNIKALGATVDEEGGAEKEKEIVAALVPEIGER